MKSTLIHPERLIRLLGSSRWRSEEEALNDGLARGTWNLERWRKSFSLEIQFLGPGTTDTTPEFIDQGIAASYRFMHNLGLEN